MATPFTRAGLAVVWGLALTAACSSEPRSEAGRVGTGAPPVATPADLAQRPRVGTAADLSATMQNAALATAYQWKAGALAAEGSTFESRALGHGAFEITPRLSGPLAPRGSTLSLETTLVARGERVLAEGHAAPVLEGDGSVLFRRGVLTERVASAGDGVEQSWQFDRAPGETGNLVVHVRASGQDYAKATDHGLHFGGGGGLGLRYGTATWIDATGKRTVIAPRYAAGEIVLTVPDAVVASSKYPAVLDPTVTPEREIDAPIAGSTATGEQTTPTIASAGPGAGYLAVWLDRRGVRPALYATRLGSDGTVLDNTGIPLVQGVSVNAQPFVAGAPGTGYIVVWTVANVDLYQSPGVYAVRLDTNGAPIDKAPVSISANQTNVSMPNAAFDGTNYFVTWQRYGGTTSYDIAGARIGKTGGVIDTTPIEVSKLPDYETNPFVFFDGTDYMVIWRSYYTAYARKVLKDGTMPAAASLIVGAVGVYNYMYNYAAGFDGTQFLVSWSQYGTNSYDLYGQRVSLAGAKIDAAPLALATDLAISDDRPRVIGDAAGFLVAFVRNSFNLNVKRVTGAGVVDAAPTQITTSSSSTFFDHWLASDGAAAIDVYREYGGSTLIANDIRGVRIPTVPAAATPFVVSKAANSETEPSTAWNGTNYFSVWLDTRDGRTGVYGSSMAADGTPTAPVKVVSDVKYASDFQRPRIVSDGGTGFFMVFWAYDSTTGRRGIRGVRLDAAGVPDATGVFNVWVPTDLNETDSDVNLAFDGTNYLVVFQQLTNTGGQQTGIAAIRVPATGTTIVDKEPLLLTTKNQVEVRSAPSVAYDGQNYFVSWQLARPSASGIQVSHIFGSRVSKEGTAIDGELSICDAFLLQRAPIVAADKKNGGFLVVWEDYRTAIENADIYGARITPQGQSLDGTTGVKIVAGSHDESRPRAASAGDGVNWVVAWRDLRTKETYDIYGAWVSKSSGKNLDGDGVVLSAEAGDEDLPWLDSSGPGKLLLTYQRLDPRTGYGSYRVKARTIDSGAVVATACTSNDQCASRSCVDGVCCSTECGGCGVCNVQPGTCTPRETGAETTSCPAYKCKGTLECPNKCDTDADCASNATCEQTSHTCVSRIICIDDHTLKDLTGKLTDCGAYKCIGDSCRTQCGSVDDCAIGFVCDQAQRCIKAPGAGDTGGCAASGASSSPGGGLASSVALLGLAWMAAGVVRRRRRR